MQSIVPAYFTTWLLTCSHHSGTCRLRSKLAPCGMPRSPQSVPPQHTIPNKYTVLCAENTTHHLPSNSHLPPLCPSHRNAQLPRRVHDLFCSGEWTFSFLCLGHPCLPGIVCQYYLPGAALLTFLAQKVTLFGNQVIIDVLISKMGSYWNKEGC